MANEKETLVQNVFKMVDQLVDKATRFNDLEDEANQLRQGLRSRDEEVEDLQTKIADMADDATRSEAIIKDLQKQIEDMIKAVRPSDPDVVSFYGPNSEAARSGAGSTAARVMREALRANSSVENVGKGEPVFTLRAQDMLAPEIVREWAFRAKRAGSPDEKVEDARRIADEMEDWQIANRRHLPD
jgi:TolA-binding protein